MNSWISKVATPCYVIDENKLSKNLEILQCVKRKSGCKILLAQKAYSAYDTYPLIAEYLDGCTASGLYEARLGFEEMAKPFGRENHVFSPAYNESEFDELLTLCDHIVFNSPRQWARFRDRVRKSPRKIAAGIRINPQYSEIETELYNPCAEGSRLGTTLSRFMEDISLAEGIDGLHFHTMCEQGADVLERTVAVVEEQFGFFFDRIKWINFGGGHHITRESYDLELLISTISYIKDKYNLEVYLEPGEAIALNAGYAVSTVMDVLDGAAIVDISAACHMPDVLEMPYTPRVVGEGDGAYRYRVGGNTCLAGDIIGEYAFDAPLREGDRLVFEDMAIYSMCKNNTFNGMPLPSIYLLRDGEPILLRSFDYEDFKYRLGQKKLRS